MSRFSYLSHLLKCALKQPHSQLQPLLRRYITETEPTIIDVGGHGGQFTKLFAKMYPRGKVITFEPNPYALSIITKVIRLHRLKNVSLLEVGLSDEEGVDTLYTPIKTSGSRRYGLSHFQMAPDQKENHVESTAKLATFDRLAEERALTRIDFMKIDIEGWEVHMLKGAKQSIEKFKPVIMCEIEDESLKRAGSSAQELLRLLKSFGYKIDFLDEKAGELTPLDDATTSGDLWCY